MEALRSRLGKGSTPESWLASAFMLPLPAATFAWWALIVRPVWMPDLAVREAVGIAYLWFALLPALAVLVHPRGAAAVANWLTLAALLALGASVFLFPAAAGLWLAVAATLSASAAVVIAVRVLVRSLRPIPERGAVNYLLAVLPAVLVVVVAETVLWQADRYNVVRLVVVSLCAAGVLGSLRFWRRMARPYSRFLIILVVGMLLAVLGEVVRLYGGEGYAKLAMVLQGFGGRFAAYFGASVSLALLPGAFGGKGPPPG